MVRKKIIKYAALLALLIAIIYAGIAAQQIIAVSGALNDYKPHFAGQCQTIEGIIGAEDITIDAQGMAFLSATDRRAVIAGKKTRGRIAQLDLTQSSPVLRDITPDSPSDFRPHGISLFTADDGRRFLFVINHLSNGKHSIERFRITKNGKLQHNGHFQSPAISSPNDIAAIGEKQFYITNDLGSKPDSLWRLPELLLALPWGSLAYFDGQKAAIIQDGLRFPNGINVSADGKRVYLAELLGRQVIIFERDPATNQLTQRSTIAVPSSIDNIEIDGFGDLWIAAHPKFFAFGNHINDPKVKAPSQVFRVSPTNGEVEEIYYNDGEALSASATAAPYKKRIMIGPVLDDHALLCDRD